MKKGFTLMELLGSVVIMSIVLTIATISVVAIINSAKQKAYNTQVQLIVSKAKDWALDNETKLTPDGGINFIDLSTLVSSGYVDNPTISDPRNGSTMSGCIVIIYNSDTSQYEYRYSDSACSVEQAKYGPTWSSNNPKDVEVGTTYVYGTVKAYSQSSTKNELKVTGPTLNIVDKDGNIIKANVDTMDTSYVTRIYSLTYSAYDPIYKYTFHNTDYVIVKDRTAPIITLGPTKETEKSGSIILDTKSTDGSADIYLLTDSNTKYAVTDMVVNDNSCDGLTEDARSNNNCGTTLTETMSTATIDISKPFTWLNASPIDVTYEAKDSSNNTTKYVVHYYVAPKSYAFDEAKDSDIEIYYPGIYELSGSGAQGGNGTEKGGLGGSIAGTTTLNFKDIIHVSVGNQGGGGQGATGTIGYANGGKSTIISKSGTTLLVAAGGGAGGSTAGGNGGSGEGTGGTAPAVCTGTYGYVYTDGSDTTSSGEEVCSTKRTSEASPNPPSACSSGTGATGTNGSGGGSSGSITYNAHRCSPVHDSCRTWNYCQSTACGCATWNYCQSSECGCATWNTCSNSACGYASCAASNCGRYCSGGWYWNWCYTADCGCASYSGWSYNATELKCTNQDDSSCTDNCSQYDFEYEYQKGVTYSSAGGCKTKLYNRSCSGYNYCQSSDCDSHCEGWTYYTCQSSECGYASCATSGCGCQTYSSCRTSGCGCETYASCRTSSCGCETWNWKDGGYDYSATSTGNGAQGGRSSVQNGVTQTSKSDGDKSVNGIANISIVK